MKGYKCWTGLAITVIGVTGLSGIIAPEQFEELISAIFKIVGILVAVYGNYDAHRRLKDAEIR